jgi:hypothetical protein
MQKGTSPMTATMRSGIFFMMGCSLVLVGERIQIRT